jgi:hypothetical protein
LVPREACFPRSGGWRKLAILLAALRWTQARGSLKPQA